VIEFELLTGDALELLRQADDRQVRCCVTSPPYYGLRDYLTGSWEGGDSTCKHRFANPQRTSANDGTFADERGTQKKVESLRPMLQQCRWCGARRVDTQIGLESSVELYVQRLVEVFREVRRVLTDDGTLWLNIGDSYNTRPVQGTRGQATKQSSTLSGGVGNEGGSELLGQLRGDRDPKQRTGLIRAGYRPNRGGEAQGLKHKDLIGVPWRLAFALQADGWWLRDDIIWEKPNPLPESVRDRPTRAHEYLFLLSKSQNYFYDYEAIKEPVTGNAKPRGKGVHPKAGKNEAEGTAAATRGSRHHRPDGFNARWNVRANSSFCASVTQLVETRNRRDVWRIASEPYKGAHYAVMPTRLVEPCVLAGSAPGDLVLDPFYGSGTVGAVSLRHGRSFVGIDLDPKNVALAEARIFRELTQERKTA
jgi:site-specific DNA-methyltransferase (cytosine-N4-specific)